jgi:hypothetical protein
MEMRKWEYWAAYWFRWMEMYCIQSSVILLVFGHFFLNFFYFILNINIKKIIEYNWVHNLDLRFDELNHNVRRFFIIIIV